MINIIGNVFWLSFLLSSFPDNSWDLKKDADGIKVYTRKISTSDFKELRCQFRVEASLSAIVNLLTDVDHFPDWIYKCIEANEIRKVNPVEGYSYQLFDAPWPLDDRDIVTFGKVLQDQKTKVVTVSSVVNTTLFPEKKGIVRIKKFHSKYTLTPSGNGWVEVDYEMGSEPGGIVPAWLVNLVAVKGPFETHKRLIELLEKPEFSKAKLEYIAEP